MTYSEEEIRRQLSLGEDSHWEFKQIEFAGSRPRSPRRDDLADEIAAFANAAGGVLLCGITDSGEVQGMSREQIIELDSVLVEVSSDAIRPAVRIRTHHEQLDGKRLLLVEVPEGESLHESPSGSYVRVGGTKQKMTSDEGLRLAQRRGQARFRSFDEQSLPETGFGTLDESLWKPLLTAEGAANPELALGKLALLLPDEAGIPRATVAGVLLCTRNPEQWLPNACITATHYRGKDRASGQIDAQEMYRPAEPPNRRCGGLRHKEHARCGAQGAGAREPASVQRQGTVRGCGQCRGASRLFDACEQNPPVDVRRPHGNPVGLGSLPNNLTIDSMATRQATRNEVLTSVLGRMSVGGVQGSEDRRYFMERRGDGVPIIQRETKALSGKLPEYRLINASEVCLIIPAAAQEQSPAHAVVTIRSGGQPLPGADLLALFPNKTWKRATTGRGRGGSRRPAHNSSPYDGVRWRTRVCRTSRTGMDPQPGSTHDRGSSPTGRW